MPQEPLKVAVVGGGIGGLALLIGLLNHTDRSVIIPHLYEAAPKFAEIGAGVAFGPNAVRAMKIVDPRLHEAYQRIAVDAPVIEVDGEKRIAWHHFIMGVDGKSSKNNLKAMDEVCTPLSDNPKHNVHRAVFLDEMLELLGEDGKKEFTTFDKRCKEIKELGEGKGVELQFMDGTTAYADAVIGCDGIKSRTRQILLKDQSAGSIEPQFTGKYAYRGLIPMSDAVSAIGDKAKINTFMLGYGGHLVTFPIDQGKTCNVVAFCSAPEGKWTHGKEWVVKATIEDALEDFKGWSEPVKKLLGLFQKPDKWAIFDHPPATTYHRQGNICILGDCAHASSPHQGAGAGMAIEDAAVLSRVLSAIKTSENGAKALSCAFETFDQSRRQRSQNLVTTSRDMGLMVDLEKEGVDDDVEQLKELSKVRFNWLWQHDVEVESDNAIQLFQKKMEGTDTKEMVTELQSKNTKLDPELAKRINAKI